MHLIFNKHGHYEMTVPNEPAGLVDGSFSVRGERLMAAFGWSDGKNIFETDVPPPSQYHELIDGVWVLPKRAASLMLAAAKSAKISNLNAAAQAYIDAAAETDKLPAFEVQTWPLQAAEAKAWAADTAAPTPVLDGIAAARGVPVEQLKAAALRKTLAYEALTASIAGQRQALQAKIEAAKTQAALDKIVIAFTPPEAV